MNYEQAERNLINELLINYPPGEAQAISALVMEKLTGKIKSERVASKTNLDAEQVETLTNYTSRLLQHEPVQYILNEAWFCGLKFYVDNRVLIPRPETEELVEWVISNCKFPVNELTIVDIGTGSGCIPVSLKRRIRKAEVWSIDISADAQNVALINSQNLGAPVHFLCLDFLDEAKWNQIPSSDIIVSNPPYIPRSESKNLQPNVREYEPSLALFVPDGDALIFYKALAEFGRLKLKSGGALYAETHEDLAQPVAKIFRDAGYTCEIRKDMQGKERMIRAAR